MANLSIEQRMLLESFSTIRDLNTNDLNYVREIVSELDIEKDNLSLFIVHTCNTTHTGRLSLIHHRNLVDLIKRRDLRIELNNRMDIWPEVEDNPNLTDDEKEIIMATRDLERDIIREVINDNVNDESFGLPNMEQIASQMLKLPYESLTKKSLFEEKLENIRNPPVKDLIKEGVSLPSNVVHIPVRSDDTGLISSVCYGFIDVIRKLAIDDNDLPISDNFRDLLCRRYSKEIIMYRYYLEH